MTYEEKLAQSDAAQKLAEQIRDDLATLRNTPSKVANLLVAMRQEILQANASNAQKMTPAGMAELEGTIRNRVLQELDRLEQLTQVAKESIERRLKEAEDRPKKDAQSLVLEELKKQRQWARISRILDRYSGQSLAMAIEKIAQTAADDGDLAKLELLESEIPDYLEARQEGFFVSPVMAAISQAKLPHLPPAARQAVRIRRELTEGWPRLAATFQMAKREVSAQGGKVFALPGWLASERLNIN